MFSVANGVIVCFHIGIQKFHEYGDEYVNRRGLNNINMEASCNASEIFTSIDCQWPGSVEGNRNFENSTLYDFLDTLRNSDQTCSAD